MRPGASVNWVAMGLWISVVPSSTATNWWWLSFFSDILKMFFQQNGFETALCKLSVVVFWSQRVKTTQKKIITLSTQLGPTRHIWVKINLYNGLMPMRIKVKPKLISLMTHPLIHWGRDEIDTILQTAFSNVFTWTKMYKLRLRFSLNFVPKVRINNIPALVQIMACRRPGDKPLYDQWWLVYCRIYASLGLSELM